MNKLIKVSLVTITLLFASLYFYAQDKTKPTLVIFDSDMGPDYDDVGAITMLHALADSGYAKILATIASTKYEGVAAVFNVFNTYFNRPDLPIAVPGRHALELKDWQHWTDTLIARYPHVIKSNDEVPDAVELYRKILSQQPDNGVTIITVGFLTNLANLLRSTGDQYSSLDGKALVNQKVNRWVCMGGKFPFGSEFNLREDIVASQYVFENWQKPILFSGFEIGQKIKTGIPLINNQVIKNSPVKDVFRICIPLAKEDSQGRMSWDETAVLVAILGHRPWYTLEPGVIQMNSDGTNKWSTAGARDNRLVEEKPPSEVERLINRLIQHQPSSSK